MDNYYASNLDKSKRLEYASYFSTINPSFWSKYTEIKLDIDRLNDEGRPIFGAITNLKLFPRPIAEVDSTSFNSTFGGPNTHLPMPGLIFNKNTIEQFKDEDKQKLIEAQGSKLWEKIENGEALENPSLLNNFFMLTYVDLKKYNYYYWFAFPVIANIVVEKEHAERLDKCVDAKAHEALAETYKTLELNQKSFFFLNKNNFSEAYSLASKIKVGDPENLADYDSLYCVFADPNHYNENPGWTLRNFISLLLHHCPKIHGKVLTFMGLRFMRKGINFCCKSSIVLELQIPDYNGDFKGTAFGSENGSWTGWEKNDAAKMIPRMVNMRTYIDPINLMDNAVDLNLKLMKWRILPDIDLEKIKTTKCLLLGSGTLGCAVGRSLLGWGVRNITFIDNSRVSLSNPVRQSLFTYDDAVKRNLKAQAAAENLKKIFPGVNSAGIYLHIPMPGHMITSEREIESAKSNAEQLAKLIEEHDIIFLLMDSRESRWLPTVLSTYFRKIVINAALGFDTYLVMRHGVRSNLKKEANLASKDSGDQPGTSQGSEKTSADINPEGCKSILGQNLGCYFCNDITAPGNSTKERTLDQQCTVTRPGVSLIAGSLAVELAVSILQHKDRGLAPAFYKTKKDDTPDMYMPNECNLGLVPHSIRGFLSSFSNILPATEKYVDCIACSEKVVTEYSTKGFEFLIEVFNNSKYLEELVGLSAFQEDPALWEMTEEDDF